jgi:hypothetical protein
MLFREPGVEEALVGREEAVVGPCMRLRMKGRPALILGIRAPPNDYVGAEGVVGRQLGRGESGRPRIG